MYSAIRKLQQKRADGEEGFTLIELLVVIIIIGILAAIAIPVFLNQRQKGWDAQAESDLRNAAVIQETIFTESGAYGANIGALTAEGWTTSADTTAATVTGTATNYCVSVVSKSGTTFAMDSDNGSPQQGTC